MKFMIIRIADTDTEAGVLPNAELITAILEHNEEMAKARVLLDRARLRDQTSNQR